MFGKNEQFGQPGRTAFAEKWVERARLEGPLAPFPVLIHNRARLPCCYNQVSKLGW